MRCTLTKLSKKVASQAFTLVEVLVIAPFVILAIGAFVVVIVTLTGESLSTKGTNDLIYNSQTALDTIERDASLTTEFRATTTYSPTLPQGAGGSTGYNGSNPIPGHYSQLVMRTLATTENPLSVTRSLVYKNISSVCSTTSLYTVDIVYFVRNGSLWRRVVKDPGSTPCVTPWQNGSCNPESMSVNTSVCVSEDSELVQNVASMTVSYFDKNGYGTTPSANAVAVRVTLYLSSSTGGRESTYNTHLYIQRRNAPLAN